MAKLTKTELRFQQYRLGQLQKYLPTLQLKKMLLQLEVNQAEQAIEQLRQEYSSQKKTINTYVALLADRGAIDLFPAVKIIEVRSQIENIAGIDLPIYEQVIFQEAAHFLFDAPVWLDSAIEGLRKLLIVREKIHISEKRKAALEKELREVSIRVNLFEKVLIPKTQENIRKIKIFLGDQQLAAVCQAKVAKQKIISGAA